MAEPRNQQNYIIPITGGVTTAVNNLGTAAIQVIAASPNRRKLVFHNPSDVDILVCQATDVSGATLTPSFAARGGAFLVYGNGGTLTVDGDAAGSAWKAIAASGSNKGLTIVSQTI